MVYKITINFLRFIFIFFNVFSFADEKSFKHLLSLIKDRDIVAFSEALKKATLTEDEFLQLIEQSGQPHLIPYFTSELLHRVEKYTGIESSCIDNFIDPIDLIIKIPGVENILNKRKKMEV